MKTAFTFAASLRQDVFMGEDGRFDVAGVTEVTVGAEALGYTHVVVPDHIFVPKYWAKVISDLWLDPLVLLSYLAARTSRIGLVIGCLVVPYRQPFGVAKAVASLDQVSKGRMALGITPGYLKEEFDTFALSIEERGRMTNEFTRIMIELWTAKNASHKGKYYSF
jgi:alkanesulfonate monooxygenase SsuD/methylene tetrahydromethanopterin reductase-like flavin-dependent oxidoreductase (luciferase family)